jgi:hypothetical protein
MEGDVHHWHVLCSNTATHGSRGGPRKSDQILGNLGGFTAVFAIASRANFEDLTPLSANARVSPCKAAKSDRLLQSDACGQQPEVIQVDHH